MADQKDLAAWAKRFAKRGGVVHPTVEAAPPAQIVAPSQVPHVWDSASQRWVPVQLPTVPWQMPAAPNVYVRPATPQPVPWQGAGAPSARGLESDMCVKAGPAAWTAAMASAPDLAPDATGGADAMNGTMSESSRAALQEARTAWAGDWYTGEVRPGDPLDAPRRQAPMDGYRGAPAGAVPPLAELPQQDLTKVN